ncbi:hypothetical protein [Methanimicrococcus hongohii]|nr:hypothetical protein [Methanimicrococcus sp. Hf6]
MIIIVMMPDAVVSVMCQMIAYRTRDDPKSVIAWLPKKRAVFCFQFANGF